MKERFASNLLVLDSREAILAMASLLESLALRCGQPGTMHWLPYFLDEAVLGRRLPRLVLFLTPDEANERSLRAESLQAAALFFEYQLCGRKTGIIATADAVGFNSVLAPAGQRSRTAALAAQALLERGGSLCVATVDEEGDRSRTQRAFNAPGVRWAVRNRRVARMLPLASTLDETLARMGKATRFNLRYYRRRLQKQMACEFLGDAWPSLRGADLQALNAASLNPVDEAEFRRRVGAASALPGSFLCGLRAADGRWLSLIGGWRQEKTTVLHWQMNSKGFEKHSIGTVMRSFFLENEIARGSRKLMIYGGTPHSMGHAFEEDTVTDLVVEQASMRSSLVRHAARFLLASPRIRPNFVLETMSDPALEWQNRNKSVPGSLRGNARVDVSSTLAGSSAIVQRSL